MSSTKPMWKSSALANDVRGLDLSSTKGKLRLTEYYSKQFSKNLTKNLSNDDVCASSTAAAGFEGTTFREGVGSPRLLKMEAEKGRRSRLRTWLSVSCISSKVPSHRAFQLL